MKLEIKSSTICFFMIFRIIRRNSIASSNILIVSAFSPIYGTVHYFYMVRSLKRPLYTGTRRTNGRHGITACTIDRNTFVRLKVKPDNVELKSMSLSKTI